MNHYYGDASWTPFDDSSSEKKLTVKHLSPETEESIHGQCRDNQD